MALYKINWSWMERGQLWELMNQNLGKGNTTAATTWRVSGFSEGTRGVVSAFLWCAWKLKFILNKFKNNFFLLFAEDEILS